MEGLEGGIPDALYESSQALGDWRICFSSVCTRASGCGVVEIRGGSSGSEPGYTRTNQRILVVYAISCRARKLKATSVHDHPFTHGTGSSCRHLHK